MGYLPVIVAVVGFIFLWGIVNFHSLKNRRKEVEDASKLVFRYAALRQNIIIQISNIENDDKTIRTLLKGIANSLIHVDKNASSASTVIANGQVLSQKIDELPDQLGKERKYRTSIEQLQKADYAYRVAANRFTLKQKQYSELLTKSPSKFVATIFGFKSTENQHHSSEVTLSSSS